MIKSIVLENFFSFGKPTSVCLNQDVNVNVGINGSGKSNYFKAIRLLCEGVVGNDGFEKIFLTDWGGFSSVGNYSKNQVDFIKLTYEFDGIALGNISNGSGYKFRDNPIYEIVIHKAGSTGYYLSEWLYNSSSDRETPFTYLKMESGRGVISVRNEEERKIELERYPDSEKKITFKDKELVLRQISEPNKYFPHYTLKRAIEDIAVYTYFDTTINSPVRQLSSYSVDERLYSSGSNLVQILQRIKNHHSLSYDRIVDMLKNVNHFFKDISFDILAGKSLLVLREGELARSVPADHISDGTLRFLLLLSIFYNPERGNLICIDEPEIGLHPDMINSVAKGIRYASQNGTQIVINTHSPLLLNSFHLEDLLIFEKNKDNETIVLVKDEDDFPVNSNLLVGQLWLSGKLGGARWQ